MLNKFLLLFYDLIQENLSKKKADSFLNRLRGGRWGSNPRPPEPQPGALTN
jgi:hypothetical protein